MSNAVRSIAHGLKYPYDGTDGFWNGIEDATHPDDWAHVAARGIMADLLDRRQVKNGFHGIEENVRVDIVSSIAEIIRYAHNELDPNDER